VRERCGPQPSRREGPLRSKKRGDGPEVITFVEGLIRRMGLAPSGKKRRGTRSCGEVGGFGRGVLVLYSNGKKASLRKPG